MNGEVLDSCILPECCKMLRLMSRISCSLARKLQVNFCWLFCKNLFSIVKCDLPAVEFWTNHWMVLCLHFFICKMGFLNSTCVIELLRGLKEGPRVISACSGSSVSINYLLLSPKMALPRLQLMGWLYHCPFLGVMDRTACVSGLACSWGLGSRKGDGEHPLSWGCSVGTGNSFPFPYVMLCFCCFWEWSPGVQLGDS